MPIERVFVAGAGLMGHGIAQVLAAAGRAVTLYEPDRARAEAGRQRISGNLARAVAKGRLDQAAADQTLDRIEPTSDPSAVATADLVVEAVFEDEGVKRALWADLDRARPRPRSSRPTPRRSRSTAWPRQSPLTEGAGSSACTSSVRCR